MIKIIISLLVTMTLIPVVYAEEFDIDGYIVTAHNPHITEINLDWGSGVLPSGTILFDTIIDDTVILKIPKEMPRTTNLDFGFGLYAIQSPTHAELLIKQTETNCFYILEIPVRNSDKIEITSVSVAAGRIFTEFDKGCEDVEIIGKSLKTQLENQLHIKEIICKNEKHVLSKRPNDKLACAFPTTADYLGWSIIHNKNTPFSSVYQVKATIEPYFVNQSSTVIADIPYTIQGGTIEVMAHDTDANSLLVRIDSSSDGFLTVDLSYQLFVYEEQNACDVFTLVNQEEVARKVSDSRNGNKIVTVNFTNNDPVIEFIGIIMPC